MNADSQPWQEDNSFRMRQLQVFNWGTFSGLHSIPIAWQGYLFVGHSGSGKSTLLDAIAALLVPPRWVDFNAAARELERSKRDRNLLSYIRGAYSEQTDQETGTIGTQYLRPLTTWSAIALTYSNGMGQTVTLLQVLFIKGSSNDNSDVRRQFFVIDRSFDLKELDGFDLDIRKLKAKFVDAYSTDDFRPYCDKFCRALGIGNDAALRLLHKTQSAKHLGDLNAFLRDFMLEKPETFTVCERLVTEFRDLSEAHRCVVSAREQVGVLLPARDKHITLLQQEEKLLALQNLQAAIEPYRETLRRRLLDARIAELKINLQTLHALALQANEVYDAADQQLRLLQQRHLEMGGGLIDRLEEKLQDLTKTRDQRLAKSAVTNNTCEKLGWPSPASPELFSQISAQARTILDNWQADSDRLRTEQMSISAELFETQKRLSECQCELDALRKQPSNIDSRMLVLRRRISTELQIPETSLPFVGELIQVRADQNEWQGAIERLLHGFALSLLVEEKFYNSVSAYVNKTDLKGRLFYHLTLPPSKALPRQLSFHSNTVFDKLELKQCTHLDWLENELRQRYDYQCVNSTTALRNAEYAITTQGLIRHGKSRHEKDDRSGIDNRRHWVLGFDNREKLKLFEEEEARLTKEVSDLTCRLHDLRTSESKRKDEALHCQTLTNIQWQEIDVVSILQQIDSVSSELKAARSQHKDLEKIGREIDHQRGVVADSDEKRRKAGVEHDRTELEQKKLSQQLANLPIVNILETDVEQLSQRLAEVVEGAVNLDNFERSCSKLSTSYNNDISDVKEQCSNLRQAVELAFVDFKRRWPAETANMDVTIESAPDFIALLMRLETDRLPEFEAKFFDLLRNQSHQNLASLSTHLNQARKAILEKMEFVNESLSKAEFGKGTYLFIKTTDRQLPDVLNFKQELFDALRYAWGSDNAESERRFEILRRLVERLSSEEPDQKRWRESVLDVRQHVEFVARELDESGAEVEIYRSGAGKSGGQRQKLATTCLAAALHYQLRRDDGLPSYAAVVLDEAFDKADNEFTSLAMNIFREFGFQMIVATPLKSVRTLEPFIGGACFVHIRDRQSSSVLLIDYDEEHNRLALPDGNIESALNVSLLASDATTDSSIIKS